MANETIITVIGRATGDPELKFTPSGKGIATFTLATNPRTFNKQTNEWENGEATFYRVQCWSPFAENVSESILKGNPLIVVGHLSNRKWTSKDGEDRWSLEINAQAVGHDLRWGTTVFSKQSQQSSQSAQQRPQSPDPFNATTGDGGWGSSSYDNQPPF